MFRIFGYTLFFLLCLAFALVINLPVVHIMPWVKLPNTIQIDDIDGTVVSGRAQQITLNNFPVRGVEYRFMPSCFFSLKVCYHIDFDEGRFQAAYDLVNGDTEVNDGKIVYPVSVLAPYIPNLPMQPVGNLELLIDGVSLVQGKPAALAGKLIWRDLGIDEQGVALNIGDYQIEISGINPTYDLKMTDLEGKLALNGEGGIIAGGGYSVDLNIEPRSGLDPQVKTLLELVAKKTGDNQYHIQYNGRLPANIARHFL